MLLEDVIKKHGKCDAAEPWDRLKKLGDSLFGSDNWKYVGGSTHKSGFAENNEWLLHGGGDRPPDRININAHCMGDGCSPEEMNRAGYVESVFVMFHEHQHIMQHAALHTDADDGLTDIVRRQFVTTFFRSAYEDNYTMDPSEADANLHGLKNALEWFKDDPVIGHAEASEILYEHMTADDHCIYQAWLNNYEPKNIQDVVAAFDDMQEKSVDMKYRLNPEVGSEREYDLTPVLFQDYRYVLCAFNEGATGREQDLILEDLIMAKHPGVIERAERLRDELSTSLGRPLLTDEEFFGLDGFPEDCVSDESFLLTEDRTGPSL